MWLLCGVILIRVVCECEGALVDGEDIASTTISTGDASSTSPTSPTTTAGLTCTANSRALKVDQQVLGLIVSWELNIIFSCYYKYSISIETVPQVPLKHLYRKECNDYNVTAKLSHNNSTQLVALHRNHHINDILKGSENTQQKCTFEYEVDSNTMPLLTNFVTVYYQIKDVYPCSKYHITVEVIQDTGQIAAQSVDVIDTESIALNETENLNIKTTVNSILLSWKAAKYADICKISYNIYMVKKEQTEKDIPYYRHENRTQHKIRNLESCTSYNVSVVPSDIAWRSDDDNDYGSYNGAPNMVHTVSTLPEEVSGLEVTVNKDSTTISWTPPSNTQCIKEYQVTINQASFTTTSNYVDVNHVAYCKDIAVTPIDLNDLPGKAVHIFKPGPVQDLNSYPEATSVTVSWLPPLNNSCVEEYVVRLNDQVWSTKWSEFTFENLASCTEYEMQVSAKSTDNTTGKFLSVVSETLPPQEIGPPENATIEYENNILNLNWEPPQNAQACNVSYTIRIIDNSGKEVFVTEKSENVETVDFNSSIGCMEYTIVITPQILSTKKGKPLELYKKISKVRNAPTCNILKTNKTSATFECDIGTFESNLCSLDNLTVMCKASDHANKIRNAKKPKEVTEYYKFVENPLDPLVHLTVDSLSVFTNYTCIGFTTNTAGRSLPSVPISFRTQENVPSAPQLIQIVDVTNTSFTVKWLPPKNIHGNLVKYRIGIKNMGPLYFVPPDCNVEASYMYSVDIDSLQNEFMVTGAFPVSTYKVYVQAVTGAGPGEKATLDSVVTKAGVPNEPRNVDFAIDKTEGGMFDENVTVTWWYPCYTNGRIKHFIVDLVGTTTSLKEHREQNILSVNTTVPGSVDFTTKFKLLPAYSYVITVKTINQNDLESNPVQLTFTSPETYPEMPVLKSIGDVTKNSFEIEWSEPSNTNGLLTNYTIDIIHAGALHKVPEECKREMIPYKFIQPPNVTSFKFENGISNYRYKVTVAAATKVGYGPLSEPLFIETLQSESEQIREAKLLITDSRKEEYNVAATVTFKWPCNTNGHLRHFAISLFGSRTNYPIHKSEISLEGSINQDNSAVFKLLPAHNYFINIQVITENFHSDSTPIHFSSPAGIPPILQKQTSVMQLKAYNNTCIHITLNRNMFSDANGQILYYAVIVAPDLEEIRSSYGVWDGINWPQIDFGFRKSNVIGPYQASPNFWNPFDGSDVLSYTFIVGSTTLSKTNTPLQPDTSYKVLIRGLTQNGYRDSPAVQFVVPGIDDSHLALIIGLVFGVIGTTVFVAIAFICRKRSQWLSKKNSIKLAPLTPLSVSIERFPEYYTKIKSSNEQLKEEFTLLNRKSTALVLPTYEALRPENKKKNRYTNVLPYDETRVKLIDVGDGSDYINASYIQGYSRTTEYIATQGPLEHTFQDFWKMIIQENVSLIVMIAQFVELNKQKCYKYFPDNHENMELENGIAIRCCTELSFKSYTVRTLLVQKELHQWTITHLQFTEWPDFGCPEGTQNTLEFSHLIREHAERNQDPIVVHCSAGVGRTGTLIALDILFQALSNKDDINIFETVLNLRKDRKSMVQTEKQYLYIHECISIVIANPERLQKKCDSCPQEAIYENVEEIKMEKLNNGITESAL